MRVKINGLLLPGYINEFFCQNKFVIEKYIKFIIETDTYIKFIEQ